MSSLLFSPTCLNPLEGLIRFTQEVKPFHTKILETTVALSFADQVHCTVTEDLVQVISQNHDYSRGLCLPDQAPCQFEGFEVEPFDSLVSVATVADLVAINNAQDWITSAQVDNIQDDAIAIQALTIYVEETTKLYAWVSGATKWITLSLAAQDLLYPSNIEANTTHPVLLSANYGGYEPTLQFIVDDAETLYPTGTVNAAGQPLYYHFNSCYEENNSTLSNAVPVLYDHRNQVEVIALYFPIAGGPIELTLASPSLGRTGDKFRLTTNNIANPSTVDPVVLLLSSLLSTADFLIEKVDPFFHEKSSWLGETYRLRHIDTEQYVVSTSPTAKEFACKQAGIDFKFKRIGLIPSSDGQTVFEDIVEMTNCEQSNEPYPQDCYNTCGGSFTGGQKVLDVYDRSLVYYDDQITIKTCLLPQLNQTVLKRYAHPYQYVSGQWTKQQQQIVYVVDSVYLRNHLHQHVQLNVGDIVIVKETLSILSAQSNLKTIKAFQVASTSTASELTLPTFGPSIDYLVVDTVGQLTTIPSSFNTYKTLILSDLNVAFVFSDVGGEYQWIETSTQLRQQPIDPTTVNTSIAEQLMIEDNTTITPVQIVVITANPASCL